MRPQMRPQMRVGPICATSASSADECLPQQHRYSDSPHRGGGHRRVAAALRVVGVLPLGGPRFLGAVVVAEGAFYGLWRLVPLPFFGIRICCHVVLLYAAARSGMMTGLMQPSSLLVNTRYPSAISASGKRCVMISLGLIRPLRTCSYSRG